MRISKKDIKLAAEKRYPDKDKSKYQYGCLESLREGYIQGRKEERAKGNWTDTEIIELLRYIRACMWYPADDTSKEWEYPGGQTTDVKGVTEACYETDEGVVRNYKLWKKKHNNKPIGYENQ